MKLVDAYATVGSEKMLWELLNERTPEQSISHEKIPTFDEHMHYVHARPYPYWYLMELPGPNHVGSVYLTQRREVGIFVLNAYQHRGYGTAALIILQHLHPGTFYANIAPANEPSRAFFEDFGAKLIQNTYRFGG